MGQWTLFVKIHVFINEFIFSCKASQASKALIAFLKQENDQCNLGISYTNNNHNKNQSQDYDILGRKSFYTQYSLVSLH